jgi:hypothetical protein
MKKITAKRSKKLVIKRSKRRSKISSKRYSRKMSKRSSRKMSKRSSKRKRDGGLVSSKNYLEIEREEIESIYKSKIKNFDDVVNYLFRDKEIFTKYHYKSTIEKKLIEYIKNFIRHPIKVRIYSLIGIYTPTYMDIKNYLLYY